jgi:AraC family transcriptional regulator, transcriptional activator of pobA
VEQPDRSRRLAYRAETPSLVRTEVQRLDREHVVVEFGHHAHDFFEIVLFDSPGGSHTVAGVPEEILRGQAWMLPPGTAHDLAAIGDATGWLALLGSEQLGLPDVADLAQPWLATPFVIPFQNLDASGRPQPVQLSVPALRRWVRWLSEMQSELAGRSVGYSQAVTATLHLILIDACRRCAPVSMKRSDPLVSQALDLVDERFRVPLSLSDVARSLHVTPGHLTEMVRKQTGKPLGEWILHRRMSEARLQLGETDAPIAVVARSCGFSTVGQFARQFRRLHGVSPSGWRSSVTSNHK